MDERLREKVKRYAIIHGMDIAKVVRMALHYFLENQAEILAMAAMEVFIEAEKPQEKVWLSLQENDPFQASKCFE